MESLGTAEPVLRGVAALAEGPRYEFEADPGIAGPPAALFAG